jgi:hypothetical protein
MAAKRCRECTLRLRLAFSNRICRAGVPASAGGRPAGTAAYWQERLIRLTNVEKIVQVWRMAAKRCIQCTLRLAFSNRICRAGVPASAGGMSARAAAYWQERLVQLTNGAKPGQGWRAAAKRCIQCTLRLLAGTPDPVDERCETRSGAACGRKTVHTMHPTATAGF